MINNDKVEYNSIEASCNGLRRWQLRDVISIINTMREAHNIILEFVNSDKFDQIMPILEQCQNCAVQIGTIIERTVGTGMRAVSILEDYCEEIYKFTFVIKEKRIEKFKFQELLNLAEYEIENHIKLAPIEVVFLPYKAAMWDSLESIWIAANADKNCKAYVVPIPYYDMQEDQKSWKSNYEGDLFPKEVPITSWLNYDIAKRRPDVIYIHNPFDDTNYVTSVYPQFYSCELKKYTDMLVYVPYYYSGGLIPEHHVFLSAYKYVDKIIVQNDYYKKRISEYVPEEKIMVLGSPKCDKLINYRRGVTAPSEWEEKVRNKKLVFLNLSISGFLSSDADKYLDKMEYIIRLAQKFPQIVLIWRPHPLLDSTINAMRPELAKRLQHIRNKFIFNKQGIYDTSSDVSRTVSLCDAYIGESTSSIIHMFGILGKPIFIPSLQFMDETIEERFSSIFPTGFYFESDDLYFLSINHCYLCRMNIHTGIVEVITKINVNGVSECWGSIVKKENDIYILLAYGYLIIYNLKTKETKQITLVDSEQTSRNNFGFIVAYNEYFYLFPTSFEGIIRIDLSKMEMKLFDSFIDEFVYQRENKYDFMFYGTYWKQGMDTVYLLSCVNNKIVEFSLEEESIIVHELGSKEMLFNSMVIKLGEENEKIFLSAAASKDIYIWNRQDDSITLLKNMKEDYNLCDTILQKLTNNPNWAKKRDLIYHNVVYVNENKIFSLPCYANQCLKIDRNTGKYNNWELEVFGVNGERKNSLYESHYGNIGGIHFDRNRILILSNYDSSGIIYNQTNQKVEDCFKFRLSEKDSIQYQKQTNHFNLLGQDAGYGARETIQYTIKEFLNDIILTSYKDKEIQISKYKENIKNCDGTAGKKIHESIVNENSFT